MRARGSLKTRTARGRATQRIARAYMAAHGWPHCQVVELFAPGRDLTGTPGLAVEIKGTREAPLLSGLRQAVKYANGDLPLVIWRPDSYGPEKVGDWVVGLRLEDAVRLLRAAGYGDPEP